MLTLSGVSKSFGRLAVIQDAHLTVDQGERHALIGPNGAGKSTLFNLITGRYRPTGGSIRFKNERIDGLAPWEVTRRGIARSFQIINLFREMTVYENVRIAVTARHRSSLSVGCRLSRRGRVREEAERAMERVKLGSFRDEPAGSLGYSQQRALEVGLALALDPEVLLLDEPGAGLSPHETRDIVRLIREVTAGKTLLIVEHDMDVVFGLADRISVLHHGSVVVTGTPDEIRKNEIVKEVYLGSVFDASPAS